MRTNVETFIQNGHNVAFFSGNTCWWRVAFDDAFTFRRLHTWSDTPVPNNPENALTGVSYRNGGERDQNRNPIPVGYQVQHADPWVYEGTGLREGEIFGDEPGQYIIGYECDGAEFDCKVLHRASLAVYNHHCCLRKWRRVKCAVKVCKMMGDPNYLGLVTKAAIMWTVLVPSAFYMQLSRE